MKWVIRYSFVVAALAVLANYAYVYSGLYEKDIRICDGQLVHRIDSLKDQKDILFLSESSNFTTAKGDSSLESISDIVNRLRGKNDLAAINQAASHAGTYLAMVKRIKNARTKIIVFPVNMRSFGINFIESDLETNLSRTNIIYTDHAPIIKKFMLAFKVYDHKEAFQRMRIQKWHYKYDILFNEQGKYPTVKEWDAFMFDRGHLKPNGERNPEKCALACHFIKNYAFVIEESNPRIKDLDAIVAYCKENGITAVFDLLPDNFELAKELCGPDLITLMNNNRNFLKNRYSSNTIFVDNFSILPDSVFIDRNWPTEHYTFEGRKKVAINIANALK